MTRINCLIDIHLFWFKFALLNSSFISLVPNILFVFEVKLTIIIIKKFKLRVKRRALQRPMLLPALKAQDKPNITTTVLINTSVECIPSSSRDHNRSVSVKDNTCA